MYHNCIGTEGKMFSQVFTLSNASLQLHRNELRVGRGLQVGRSRSFGNETLQILPYRITIFQYSTRNYIVKLGSEFLMEQFKYPLIATDWVLPQEMSSGHSTHTVDGRNPTPVDIRQISHYLQGFSTIPGFIKTSQYTHSVMVRSTSLLWTGFSRQTLSSEFAQQFGPPPTYG